MTGNRVGILGGSFNPVHHGHLAVARQVLDAGLVDEVWFSVSPMNPLKDEKVLMPLAQRTALLKDVLAAEEGMRITEVESRLPCPSFMIDALRTLRKENPGKSFTFIGGADNLLNFNQWKEWQAILSEFGMIIYPRGKHETELPDYLKDYGDRITLINDVPLYDISSTEIRNNRALQH